MKTYEEPVVEHKNEIHVDSIESHPSYGQIGASRVSGSTQLYGSDFLHHNYMTIRIHRSVTHRHLSNDHHFAKGEVIEVAMSEAQWATFVSSPNIGHGVPCTLQYVDGKQLPGIKRVVNRRAQFEQELSKRLEETKATVRSVEAMVNDLPCSQKKKDQITHALGVALTNLGPNLKFTQDQFGEYMETTVERARMEINAHAQQALQRFAPAGHELNAASPVRMLEGAVEDADIVEGDA